MDYRWRRRPRRVQMHLPPARNTPSITLAALGFVTGPGAGQWRASSRHTICIVVASFVANNGIHFVIYPMPNSVRRIDTPAPRPTSTVVLLPYRVAYIRYMLTLYCLEGLWESNASWASEQSERYPPTLGITNKHFFFCVCDRDQTLGLILTTFRKQDL